MIGVRWRVAGEQVPLSWSDVTIDAPGGYGDVGEMSCPVSNWPQEARVRSPVIGVRTDGRPFYRGRIAAQPRIYQGMVRFAVEGYRERLAHERSRRLYSSEDLSEWVNADADPHAAGGYPMNDKYGVNVRNGLIAFNRSADTYAASQRAGTIFWAGTEIVTALSFNIDRSISMANWDINIRAGDGPAGTFNTEATVYNLAGTAQIPVSHDISTPSDMVGIFISAVGAGTPTSQAHVQIRDLVVLGRSETTVLQLSTLSDDLADEMNWADLSPDSDFDCAPQDWQDDWASCLTQCTDMADYTWLVTDPPSNSGKAAGLYIGPWGRHSWTLRGADYGDLEPLTLYNKAAVEFETPAGVTREVKATAEEDPYADEGISVIYPPDGPFQIDDRVRSADRAEEAAQRLADFYSKQRVRGQIHVSRVWAEDGEAHPWDIDAGDVVELADYEVAPGSGNLPVQRVVEVQRSVDGTATISISEETSLVALLSRLGPRRRRKRHHGKKRKR